MPNRGESKKVNNVNSSCRQCHSQFPLGAGCKLWGVGWLHTGCQSISLSTEWLAHTPLNQYLQPHVHNMPVDLFPLSEVSCLHLAWSSLYQVWLICSKEVTDSFYKNFLAMCLGMLVGTALDRALSSWWNVCSYLTSLQHVMVCTLYVCIGIHCSKRQRDNTCMRISTTHSNKYRWYWLVRTHIWYMTCASHVTSKLLDVPGVLSTYWI